MIYHLEYLPDNIKQIEELFIKFECVFLNLGKI